MISANGSSRIGKVTLKAGGELHILPSSEEQTRTVQFAWGEVTFRNYDGRIVDNADIVYYCEGVKNKVMFGRGEDD